MKLLDDVMKAAGETSVGWMDGWTHNHPRCDMQKAKCFEVIEVRTFTRIEAYTIQEVAEARARALNVLTGSNPTERYVVVTCPWTYDHLTEV